MSQITIEGGKPLVGNVTVSGSKNSALKLIAAALFSNEDVILENVPNIKNITNDLEIVEALGGKVKWLDDNKLLINGGGISTYEIPQELGTKYRTAALYGAALAFRFGKAKIPFPGGCKIGPRPMNRWVETWKALGFKVESSKEGFYLEAKNLVGANINFKVSTHMGTDVAILFSAFSDGDTIISNAAEEPEIDDLIDLLNLLGGSVARKEGRKIKITGVRQFNGGSFKIQNDRNEIVTYAVAALITNGNIIINGANREHLLAFVNVLSKIGAKFEISEDEMRVWRANDELKPVDVTTAPYPGFMTDWQPLITLLLTQIEGESLVHETVYWDRFGYTRELNRMGSKIELVTPTSQNLDVIVSDDTYDFEERGEPLTVAKIRGGTPLKGTKLQIPDLRAGAALVLAALAAEGKSEIIGFENVERGYEDFVDKLIALGASIK